ncbi:succinyldiaminopimelate transaminase [Leucobacter triazinivorans]|uniref:Aminotransferase n=1 Tax=Leucobacter triazinivorans TaxID=1784719 RepID=A0A4P6KD40_9MICO|nr:succinyldiaminopimelate transaminase [Leucobacter triazinivorans]QBE47821.1 succinyldiaminopimelate transaminase [Leucobacter triazinivorans]
MRDDLPDYPWDAMAPYAEEAARHPEGALNLSVGSPVDPSPESVQAALSGATDAHAYPATAGSVPLREAIAEWFSRRRGVSVAPSAVLPTIGSKELVALLPFLLGIGQGEAVVFPRIAYPSYQIGAALVGADAVPSDDPAEWPEHTRLVWLNSPSNPDGRVMDVGALQVAVARARELGAVIVGDECYAEFGWESPWDAEPVPSILDPRVVGDDHSGVLSAYSLSKQSNLAGYRAAFVAGDPRIIARLLTVRKHAGLMQPAPVQAAMVAALGDETHVDTQRARYRARRETLRPALEAVGYRIDGSEAGLYLWATRGEDAWESVAAFARLGIVVGPGHFYGEHSPRHVRLALTASDEAVAAAADRLRRASS